MKRVTEWWDDKTPKKVGPGSYNLAPNKSIYSSSVPFSTGQKRSLSAGKAGPGPGTYQPKAPPSNKRQSSSFYSRAPKIIPYAPGQTAYTLPSSYYTPGPGTYHTNQAQQAATIRAPEPRTKSLVLESTAHSIPYTRGKDAELGPTTYEPNFSRTGNLTTSFSKYRAERRVFEATNPSYPGPGEYSEEKELEVQGGWVFQSKTKRQYQREIKNKVPGPGTYEHSIQSSNPSSTFQAFGVGSVKGASLSNDPHRPFVVGDTYVPPVGTYSTPEQVNRNEKLRQKLISFDMPVAKPGFGSSEAKHLSFVSRNQYPGPGTYITEVEQEPSISGWSKTPRFVKKKVPVNPGPGSYDSTRPSSRSHSWGRTPRFRNKNSNQSFTYISHRPWSAKTNRAQDAQLMNPKLCFDSSAIRPPVFQVKSNNPGPGMYYKAPKKVEKNFRTTSSRFGQFGNYNAKTGTSKEVGPGSYTPAAPTKKSFNLSKDLSSQPIWI